MREQIEKRRGELEAERARGQQVLGELDQRRAELAQTLLRIDGAIQLCNEFLTQPAPAGAEGAENAVAD